MNENSNQECEVIGKTWKKKGAPVLGAITPLVGIYGLRHKTTNKWYIGQSRNIYFRWNYYRKLNCVGQTKLYRALKKHGYDSFEKIIIEVCQKNIPQEMLDMKEIGWIKHCRSIECGYNCTFGGSRGKHTDETKKKMSKPKSPQHVKKVADTLRGRKRLKFSKEWIDNMSKCKIGDKNYWYKKSLSSEHKHRISKSKKGKKMPEFSAEHRRKLAEATKRYWRNKKSIED